MESEAVTYTTVLLALVAGVGALLAGEYFPGADVLIYAGGAVALLAVGGLTFAISRSSGGSEEAAAEGDHVH